MDPEMVRQNKHIRVEVLKKMEEFKKLVCMEPVDVDVDFTIIIIVVIVIVVVIIFIITTIMVQLLLWL